MSTSLGIIQGRLSPYTGGKIQSFPKNTWENKNAYDTKANELANAFNTNFAQFVEHANPEILSAAPKSITRT